MASNDTISHSKAGLRVALSEWKHTRSGRRAVQAWRIATAPVELVRRRRLARAALRDRSIGRRVDPKNGYVFFDAGDFVDAPGLIDACENEIERLRPHLDELRGRQRIVTDLGTDDLLAREPAFTRFVLQDPILLPAIDYLGTVPYVARVSIAISYPLPDATEPVYFQRFHVDNDDYRHLKLYFNVRAIGPDEGPLTFLPAAASARVLTALARSGHPVRRATTFSDEEVFRHCAPSELVRVSGPPGRAALVDLSRCLHFGSRLAQGHERVVFGATILRYHRLHENPSNHIELRHARGDALRELALSSPRRHPPGRFYPKIEPEGMA
jgi:hypothetical protein